MRPKRRITKIKARRGQRIPLLTTQRQSMVEKSPWTAPVFYLLLIIAMLTGVLYLIFFANFFRVNQFAVIDNEQVSADEIKAVLTEIMNERLYYILPGNAILLLDTGRLQDELTDRLVLVSEAQIEKQMPQTLRVKVVEKKPVAVWQTAGYFYYLDQEGFVMNEVKSIPEEFILPVIIDQNGYPVESDVQITSDKFLEALALVQERLPAKLNVGIVEVFIPQLGEGVSPKVVQELRVKTSEGWEAYFDLNRPLETQIAVLLKVLQDDIGPNRDKLHYIDLRVKDKVFYQ